MSYFKCRALVTVLFIPSLIVANPVAAEGGFFSTLTNSLSGSSAQEEMPDMNLEQALSVIDASLMQMKDGAVLDKDALAKLSPAFVVLKKETINPHAMILIAKLELSMGVATVAAETKSGVGQLFSAFGVNKKAEETKQVGEPSLDVAMAAWEELKTKDLNPLKKFDPLNMLSNKLDESS